jgi:hypothetical protein
VLYITFPEGLYTVEITATEVVPEFSSFTAVPLLIAVTLLSVVVSKRRHSA